MKNEIWWFSSLYPTSVMVRDPEAAPEHPILAYYDAQWAAFQWNASHASGNGPKPWLNSYANLSRVLIAGGNAGVIGPNQYKHNKHKENILFG